MLQLEYTVSLLYHEHGNVYFYPAVFLSVILALFLECITLFSYSCCNRRFTLATLFLPLYIRVSFRLSDYPSLGVMFPGKSHVTVTCPLDERSRGLGSVQASMLSGETYKGC